MEENVTKSQDATQARRSRKVIAFSYYLKVEDVCMSFFSIT